MARAGSGAANQAAPMIFAQQRFQVGGLPAGSPLAHLFSH